MRPWQEEAAKKGAEEGRLLLGEQGLGLSLDWDLVNDWARAWAVAHTAEVVAGITTTSMTAFVDAFPKWVGSGEHLDVLIAELAKHYEPWRAEMIGVTETTRAFSSGNHAMWNASGVVDGTMWLTGVDEMVCSLCRPLHRTEAALDGTYPGGFAPPPRHAKCRCYEHPVVKSRAAGPVEGPKPKPKPAAPEGFERVYPKASKKEKAILDDLAKARKEGLVTNERMTADLNRRMIKDFRFRTEGDARFANLTDEEIAARFQKLFQDKYGAAKVTVRTPPEVVDKLLDGGRFKTQFETNSSKGALDQELRATAEEKGLGLAEKLPVHRRPVYGYLQNESEHTGAASYGSVRWELKDSVKTRTTFTHEDSLAGFDGQDQVGTALLNPQPASLDSTRRFATFINDDKYYPPSSYLEIQVQGGVVLDDVERVIIERGGWDGVSDEIAQQLKEKLTKEGFNVQIVDVY
jgi:hypothetical protein